MNLLYNYDDERSKMNELINNLVAKYIQLEEVNGNIKINKGNAIIEENEKVMLTESKQEVLAYLKGKKIGGLSFSQERLWFVSQLGAGAQYHIAGFVRISGQFDSNAFRSTFETIVKRHDSLRTCFPLLSGKVLQCIEKEANVSVDYVDFTDKTEESQKIALDALRKTFVEKEFNLEEAPLLRVVVVKLSEDQHSIGICMHHLISDGWSISIIIKEIVMLYAGFSSGQPIILDAPKIQYLDYTSWNKQNFSNDKFTDEIAYWKNEFSSYENLELPFDFARPDEISGNGSREKRLVNEKVFENLKKSFSIHGLSLLTFLTTAIYILFQRYSGQYGFCIGMPVANRKNADVHEVVGFFVNTLVINLKQAAKKDFTVSELLELVQNKVITGQDFQNVPYERIVEEVKPERDKSRNPLFQMMVNASDGNANNKTTLGNGTILTPEDLELDSAKFDLTFSLDPDFATKGYQLSIEYSTDLFMQSSIIEMMDRLELILERMAKFPEVPFTKLDILEITEKNTLLKWGSSKISVIQDGCLHHFIENQAINNPGNTAVSCEGISLNYQQFNEQAEKLAIHLQKNGVKTDTLVAVCMHSSVDMMVSLFAILKAGGAYVPIDPHYPQDRIKYIIEDCKSPVLITSQKALVNVPENSNHQLIINLDEEWEAINKITGTLEKSVDENNLAYVIYTSGSTGKPKGVLITHRNALRISSPVYIDITKKDVVMHMSNFAFDGSVFDIFCTLCNGAHMAIIQKENDFRLDDVVKFISEHQVSISFMTTALLNAMVDHSPESLKSIRKILFGGEKASVSHINRAVRILGTNRLMHFYGPTETTVYASYYEVNKTGYQQNIPIGKPFTDTELYVLDEHLTLQPIGTPGELFVSGRGVSKGYLFREELTAEKFITNPFKEGGTMYRTGDLVKWNKEGELEFLRRIDDQVKVRGYRIELGEIEQAINQISGILSSAVITRDIKGTKQLIAFYTGAEQTAQLFKEELGKAIPVFMIPAAFINIDEIPITANGKTNKKNLERRNIEISGSSDYEAPTNQTQKELIVIWQELLGVSKVGKTDDFFELGGHSLLITQLISKIYEQYGVILSLRQIFDKPVLEHVATLIENTAIQEEKPIEKYAGIDKIPLSFSQERIWFLDKLGLGHQYHIPSVLTIIGDFDMDLVEESFQFLIGHQNSLRTVFLEENDVPYQQVLPSVNFTLERGDFSGEIRNHNDVTIRIQKIVNDPFDLSKGPLIRVAVFKLDAEKYCLVLNMHHIISDGWSAKILTKEFGSIYKSLKNGQTPILEELPIQYTDYAMWQRQVLDKEGLQEEISHWKKHLSGYEDINLPTDFVRPLKLSGQGKAETIKINASLIEQLTQISRSSGKSPFGIMLTGVFALLHYYSRQESINVGIPMANRGHQKVGEVVGFFVNTVVNRLEMNSGLTFQDLSDLVMEELLRSQEHQQVPFEKVVEAVNPERDQSRTPLFQIMVNHLIASSSEESYGEFEIIPEETHYSQAKFDLNFNFLEQAEGNLEVSIEYSTDLFRESSIVNMLKQYEKLLANILFTPEKKISEINLLTEGEEQKLFVDFNDSKVPYKKNLCIHELFEQQVLNTPDQIAIRQGDKSFSFSQVNDMANRLATHLVDAGMVLEDLVGIFMERSSELVISVMAILKAGGAYVPISIENPDERIQYMVLDSNVKLILTDEYNFEKINDITDNQRIIVVSEEFLLNLDRNDGFKIEVKSQNLAYVIYTSGSTGKPKGALLQHQGVVNYLTEVVSKYRYNEIKLEQLNFAFFGNISFDSTTTTILAPLICGGICTVFGSETPLQEIIINALESEEINFIKVTPSHVKLILESDIKPAVQEKVVVIGGEGLPKGLVEAFFAKGIAMHVVNEYGPTECTISSIVHLYDEKIRYNNEVYIGKPLANNLIYILDTSGNPLPCGIPGEIYISGDGLARGYYNRSELTAEKFIENPVVPGIMAYKTGDLARWLPDGNIEFLGRIDEQVKIRGYRVELGEIENVIMSLNVVGQATVILKKQDEDKFLVCYYTSGSSLFSEETVRAMLSEQLPDYMIPVAFFNIEEMPLTPNGKVNKRVLSLRKIDLQSKAEYVAPGDETERKIAEIWQSLLHVDKVGIHDNFFELGGHSLLATQIVSRINRTFGTRLPIGIIFTADRVKSLADVVKTSERNTSNQIVKAERPDFIPLSYAQERLWFLNELGQGGQYNMPSVFNLTGNVRLDWLQKTVDLVVDRHETLRTYFQNESGKPIQKVQAKLRIPIRYYRLNDQKIADKEKQVNELVVSFNKAIFDMEYGPLVRFLLIELESNQFVFGFCIHHVISDGWSNGIFTKEFSWCYEQLSKGENTQLPALPIQYIDFALWQRSFFNEEELSIELSHWQEHLAGYQDLLMPSDFVRPAEMSGGGAVVSKSFNISFSEKIRKFSKDKSLTIFNTLTTAVYTLLHIYSNQEDITIGMPIANRNNNDLEGLIGFFANTVVNRIKLQPLESIDRLLLDVKQEIIRSQNHQDIPFEKVVDAIQPERELNRTPLFQVLVNYQVEGEIVETEQQLQLSQYQFEHDSSKFDLHFSFYESQSGELSLSLEFSTDLYKHETVSKYISQIELILAQIIERPHGKLSDIKILTDSEEQILLNQRIPVRNSHTDLTLHQILENNAVKVKDREAVVFGSERLTYNDLRLKSNNLANKLNAKGVSKNDLVAICMDRSVEFIISVVAVLQAGGGYIPIDPTYPAERKEFIIKDSQTKLVISKEEYVKDLPVADIEELIVLTNHQSIDKDEEKNFISHKDDQAISYVIYTSGSTGKPKGVLQTHKTIANLIAYQQRVYQHSWLEAKQVSQFASISFDVSVQEIFFSLLNGYTLNLIPEATKLNPSELIVFLKENQINFTYFPTAYLDYFALESNKSNNQFPVLERIIVAGEALKITSSIREFFKGNDNISLENQYGPSETHVTTTYTLSQNAQEWDYLPAIGSPVDNVSAFILNSAKRLVPLGAIGELYFGGAGLADSYLNNQELTNEKFLEGLLGERKLYRTGDLAYWNAEGNITFVGRADDQVKIRGFRIEPGEIEARLSTYEQIEQCAVMAKEIEGSNYLIAFYVSEEQLSDETLRQFLGNELPDYMIPSAFERLERIPLTHNGKTDYRNLRSVEIDFTKGKEFVAPSNETEEVLSVIWSGLLNHEKVGITDNFFEIGGHSLLATQLISRINREFKIELTLGSLFKQPTIQGIASIVSGMDQKIEENSLSSFVNTEDELTF